MIATSSLRVRLMLAFSVLVGLVLFVGVVSYGINEQVRTSVDSLRPRDRVDIAGIDIERTGVEFEGYWNPAGSGAFVATQVAPEHGSIKPKLRGPVQAVDATVRTLTMYGRVIAVAADTKGDDDRNRKATTFDLAAVKPGMRAEVSCVVDEQGQWHARQVELADIKSSDKIKGMITAEDTDGVPPDTVLIHDLRIVLQPSQERGPERAFGRIEHGTHMLQALQYCRAAAHEAVVLAADPVGRENARKAAAEMERHAAHFQQQLLEARGSGDDPTVLPPGQLLVYVEAMMKGGQALRSQLAELQRRMQQGPGTGALEYLSAELEPQLDRALLPYVYLYMFAAEEQLKDELRGVLDRTGTTTRVALTTSVVAVLVALVLGAIVWRSIHRPIRQLHDAAVALGEGRLETRVVIRSRDEFGVLATAFNGMAAELAASTVSIASLQGMFDSMAAGVILCDHAGTITTVNRAARELAVRTAQEMVGQPFASVCRLHGGERLELLVLASSAAGGSMERRFVRKDGSEFPVSLSVAELRRAGDAVSGYVFVAQDLTHLKHIEGQLRESLAEKELLLREVHHRVKNNMQVISSLLAMQSSTGDPEVRQRLEESQNRIRTIALIHEQLYQSTELARIDTRSYLQVLATHLLQSFGKADVIRLEFEVAPMQLDLDQSLACGLIVNELLTNSLKYAFPGDRRGTIRLRLLQQPDGTRLLEVGDDGCGPPMGAAAVEPRRKTLGTSLVQKLARQLRGAVTIEASAGMTVRIVFAGEQPAEAVRS